MGGVKLPAPAAGNGAPALYDTRRRAMRILRPQPEPGLPPAPALPPPAGAGEARLRCRVRLADGRVFTGELPAARHRAIQLGLLHADSAGLVELTPGTRGLDGRLALDRRRRAEHYLPGGASGRPDWLRGAARARRADRAPATTRPAGVIGGPREEAFVGVAPRMRARGDKHAVAAHALPVGRRRPARPAARPVGAAGRAAVPPADRVRRLGRRARLLEARRAAGRQRARSGDGRRGRADRAGAPAAHPRASASTSTASPTSPTPRCKERSRVMRLAGTVNHKTGAYARIVEADLRAAGLPARGAGRRPARPAAAGHAAPRRAGRTAARTRTSGSRRPSTSPRLAGITVPRARARVLPGEGARGPPPVLQRRRRPGLGLVLSRRRAAGRAARSTTSPPCSTAGRGGASCAARRSRAPARACARRSASCDDRRRPRPQPARPHARRAGRGTLYVVRVSDASTSASPATAAAPTRSPPQPRGDALALVALLLGGAVAHADGRGGWTRTVAIAGGRRTVTLEPRLAPPDAAIRRVGAAAATRER